MRVVWLLCGLALVAMVTRTQGHRYEPTWESLDTRPLPAWYDDVKFGIFLHWGVFSVPSFGSAWFWHYWRSNVTQYVDFMKKNYPPDWTYADFAHQFNAEFYNPDHWADVFEASGAKYVVLTSKHHEGFTNWPSKVSFNWNSMDVGPKRDLVGDLATAIRKKPELHFGLYHSLFEWYNPLFLEDKKNNFSTRLFAQGKTIPELYELVEAYKPEVIWSDGDPADWKYWKSPEFIAWLYNDSPVKDTVVTNDRWGNVHCKHGDFWTCNDRYNPGQLMPHKWENCMTIDRSAWTYVRNRPIHAYLTPSELITTLVETVSCGGNLLMNVGPTPEGTIIPVFEERLRQVGDWMKVNGEAIYGTKPWSHQNDTTTKHLWYTSKKTTTGNVDVYAISLDWPNTGILKLGAPTPTADTKVSLVGYSEPLKYSRSPSGGIIIAIPLIPFNNMPCQWAWVFKMTNLQDQFQVHY